MPRQIPISKVVKATLDGFKEAQRSYEKWSDGSWLWEAPEHLISSIVAKNIAVLEGSKYVTLEHGATSALENAGAKGKGRLHKNIREKGKVDILFWWGDGSPRAVIEIKNQIYGREQYEKDIKRISAFLDRKNEESSLQFGLFAFYESADEGKRKSAHDKVTDSINKVYENSCEILGDSYEVFLHKTKIHEIDNSAWAAACLLIKRIEA